MFEICACLISLLLYDTNKILKAIASLFVSNVLESSLCDEILFISLQLQRSIKDIIFYIIWGSFKKCLWSNATVIAH